LVYSTLNEVPLRLSQEILCGLSMNTLNTNDSRIYGTSFVMLKMLSGLKNETHAFIWSFCLTLQNIGIQQQRGEKRYY